MTIPDSCSECEHLVEIMMHPCNTNPLFKGSISTRVAYGCAIAMEFEEKKIFLFENTHSSCEYFTPIKEKINENN